MRRANISALQATVDFLLRELPELPDIMRDLTANVLAPLSSGLPGSGRICHLTAAPDASVSIAWLFGRADERESEAGAVLGEVEM